MVSDSPDGSTGVISATITVLDTGPTFSLSTNTGYVGDTVTITATFPSTYSGDSLTVYFDYIGSTIPVTPTPSTVTPGTSTYTFTVPHVVGGEHKVFLVDTTSSISAASGSNNYATFTVNPSITVSPLSIAPGVTATITVSGTGFKAGGTFAASSSAAPVSNILIGGVMTYHGSVSVTSTGDLPSTALTLSSPLTVNGPQTIQFIYDQSALGSETFPNAIYVSAPNPTNLKIVLSKTSGYVGDTITVTAWNLPASASISVKMGYKTLTPSVTATDSNGFVQFTVTIPELPSGTYLLVVSASNQYVSASFTINPRIKITPAGYTLSMAGLYTPSNKSIEVKGTGLAPLAVYTITDSGKGAPTLVNSINYPPFTITTGTAVTGATVRTTAVPTQ
jgi:hypothetical protein